MNIQITKTKFSIYFILLVLILSANYILYHQSFLESMDESIVIASLIDFIIVIPFLTYLFIIRNRYSLKTIGIPILGGYLASYFIIPRDLMNSYSEITWGIIGVEMIIVAIELFFFFRIVTKLPRIKKEYKERKNDGLHFIENISLTLESLVPQSPMKKVMATELSMYYYSLLSYRKKPVSLPTIETFTYHQKTSVIALNIMLIHAVVIETIGLHYFLHSVNVILSYILLIFNIYTVLLFLAEIQAIRLSPIQLNSNTLKIQIGFMKRIYVPLECIEQIKGYDGPETINKKDLEGTFDGRVNDFIQEKPMFEILLKQPLSAFYLYGISKNVNRIWLTVDEPDRFLKALNEYLTNKEE